MTTIETLIELVEENISVAILAQSLETDTTRLNEFEDIINSLEDILTAMVNSSKTLH